MADQGYNLKYTGKEIDDLLDKANAMNSSAQVPAGGTSGQVLTKKSGTDFDTEWGTPGSSLPSGGTPSQVLTKKSFTAGDAEWRDAPVQLPAGGYAGQILQKKSSTRNDADWVDMPSSVNPLPTGGYTGQVLAKRTNSNYDVGWVDQAGGGGSGGESDLFVIKVTGTSSSNFSADKTYDEMIAAYQAGKAVIMVPKDIAIINSGNSYSYFRCLPLSQFYSYATTNASTGITTTYEHANFASPYIGTSFGAAYSSITNYYIHWGRTSKSDGTVSESISNSTATAYTIPYGGKTGQLLAKKDNNSYSMQWIDPPSGGGGSGAGLTKTALWASSSPSLASQNAADLTLSDNINNYKIVYAVFISTGGSLTTGMQFLNLDRPYMGSYAWTLFAANGNARAMRLVNDTSIHIYDGKNSQGSTDATACVVTGIYGIK